VNFRRTYCRRHSETASSGQLAAGSREMISNFEIWTLCSMLYASEVASLKKLKPY